MISVMVRPRFSRKGLAMEVRTQSKKGRKVPDLSELGDRIAAEVRQQQKDWLRQLIEQPTRFGELEVRVHQAFQDIADRVVASLLAQATPASPALDDAKKK